MHLSAMPSPDWRRDEIAKESTLTNILGGAKVIGAHKSSGEFLGEHDSLTQLLQKNKQTNKNKR